MIQVFRKKHIGTRKESQKHVLRIDFGGWVSHPEIFEFQDVIKIKNKSIIFSEFFPNIYFSSQEN